MERGAVKDLSESRVLVVDDTEANIDVLVQTLRGEDSPTLFSLLDSCMTGMGSRMLKCWLLEPRRERTQAQLRLDAITLLREGLWQPLRAELKGCSDVGAGGDVAKYRCRYAYVPMKKLLSREFVESGSPAVKFLRKFRWPSNDAQNLVGKWIAGNKMKPEKAAERWVKANPKTVNAWLK